jgi:hypothetical protein
MLTEADAERKAFEEQERMRRHQTESLGEAARARFEGL